MQDSTASSEGQAVTLGERLRKRRLEAGLTQEELAERAGLSARGVSDLERGLRQVPYRDTLRRLAEALGIDETERRAWLAAARRVGTHPHAAPPAPEQPKPTHRPAPGPERPVPDEPAPSARAPASRFSEQPRPRSEGPDGELRSVTILSCQLAVARSADEPVAAEMVLALMDRLIEQATSAMRRYDGTLTAASHDGFVAVFGAPIAHEDHARRAALAALELQARLEAAADPHQLAGVAASAGVAPMRLRIGLHSGFVAFGHLASPAGWQTTVGDAMDIAVMLQRAAAPGTIVLSEATADQVAGYVRVEPVEPLPLPGRKARLAVSRVIGVGPRRSPLEGLGARPLAPFVGRQPELATLGDVLSHVVLGHGQVVGIVGEPGMGKSRLLLEFRHGLRTSPVTYLEGRCLSYASSTPYLPILDLVRASSGIQAGNDATNVVERVRSGLHQVGLNPDDHLPFMLRLLGVTDAASTVESARTPEEIKAQTFQTLRAWALKSSQQQPLILVVEDLHWIDATSEEYLTSLVESLAGAPILLLCSWRPGYRPAWVEHSYVTQLSLRRLSPKDCQTILESVQGAQRVPTALATRMLERAEGNPFFLEELARATAGQADARADGALPATIQDVLLARMASLAAAPRQVLQTAAVLGRDFSLALLEDVWDGGDALWPHLQELQRAEFVYQQDLPPEPRLSFKHALTQEVAYATMLHSTRRRLHRRVAEALQRRFGELARTRPELLAHHYTAAGLIEPAIAWWQRAGERAVEDSANVEAVSHFSQALELLGSLPEAPARARSELELQIGLSGALIVTRGYGAAETVRADTRARELAEQVGEPGQLFPLLFRRWGIHLVQSQQQVARRAAEEFLSLAERYGDPTQLLLAHSSMGVSCLVQGELVAGRQHLARAQALYDPEHHRALAFVTTFEPGAAIQTWQAIASWLLGQLDDARRAMDAAFAAARAGDHVNTLAQVLSTAGTMLAQMNRDAAAFEAHLRAALLLAEDRQLGQWHAYNTYDQGWLLAQRGAYADGIAQMRAGLDELASIGIGFVRGQQLGWLAQAYAESGQFEAAQQVFAEALAVTESSGERWWQPELDRLQGEMFLMRGDDPAAAERCFGSAISGARQQHSLTLELRAAVSLCRALAPCGKAGEAQRLVAAALARITGGDASRDVREARAILESVA